MGSLASSPPQVQEANPLTGRTILGGVRTDMKEVGSKADAIG